jgi:hypothetical protein
MKQIQVAVTDQHFAFMQAVERELSKFERKEAEFRKRDRDEREALLWHWAEVPSSIHWRHLPKPPTPSAAIADQLIPPGTLEPLDADAT